MSELILQVDGRQSGSHWSVGETSQLRSKSPKNAAEGANTRRKLVTWPVLVS